MYVDEGEDSGLSEIGRRERWGLWREKRRGRRWWSDEELKASGKGGSSDGYGRGRREWLE